MSATQNWVRLFHVQRRTRHVRRLGSSLLNHTKGWSTLNWGTQARIKTKKSGDAQEDTDQEFVAGMTEKIDMMDERISAAQRTFQAFMSMVRILFKFISLIVQLIKMSFQVGTKVGSFMYFAKVVYKAGHVAIVLFGCHSAVKMGVDLLPMPNAGDALTIE